jgi:hypothetical protein
MVHPTARPEQRLSLVPRAGNLYGVRWWREDRTEARHRFFRNLPAALAYADALRARGHFPRIFVTSTEWRPLDRRHDA